MTDAKLGPQTLEEAQASVREWVAQLDAQIQSETHKFMAEREQLMAYPVESFADQEWLSHRLRQQARAFEDRLYPVRRQRETMLNAIARVMDTQPPTFYIELMPATGS